MKAEQQSQNGASPPQAARERLDLLEAELRELQERHQLLVEGARDYAILLLTPEARIASWNTGAERLVGYAADDVIGQPFDLLFIAEDRERGLPALERATAARTGRFEDENWIQRKDGSRFWGSGVSTAQRGPDGSLRGFVKIFRDLTSRQEAQAALRERDYRLGAALAAARMGTWLWEIRADRDHLDENLRGLLGVPDDQAVETLADFLTFVHPDDRATVMEAFTRSARAGDSINIEFRANRPDGTLLWLRDQGELIQDSERGVCLAGACIDITERVEMEQSLRQARAELERRVEERTAELRQSQERALQAERLAAIGMTVAGLAHEGRNALQNIHSCAERLRWRLEHAPEALALVDDIQRAESNLERLFNDVRAYAAPIQLDHRPCDLTAVWREAWARVADLHLGRKVHLEEHVAAAGTTVEADPFRLGQVFRNLFENALDAGADRIVVAVAEAVLGTLPALQAAVRDNGAGLNDAQRQRIFEPFFTTRPSGTGLGTAIAKRILEAHGGRIGLAPASGPGAEFFLVVPRRKP